MFDKVTGMLVGSDYIVLEVMISRGEEIEKSQICALNFNRADCNELRANGMKY